MSSLAVWSGSGRSLCLWMPRLCAPTGWRRRGCAQRNGMRSRPIFCTTPIAPPLCSSSSVGGPLYSRTVDVSLVCVCVLCGCAEGDARYVRRKDACEFGRRWLALALLPTHDRATAAVIDVLGAGGVSAMRMAAWVDSLVTAVKACRHSARCRPCQAVVACLREMVRHHPRCLAALLPGS